MSSEKYQQGRRDAEAGEFNPFFYDLYYDYRLGYDEASGRGWRHHLLRHLPRLLLFLVVLIVAAGGLVFWSRHEQATTAPLAAAQPTATLTAAPSRTRVTATPIVPTAQVSVFRPGRKAVVSTGGSALKMRKEPSTEAAEVMKLRDGSEVTIVGGPIQGDNYTWWEIKTGEQQGWSAEEFLEPAT